MLKTHVSNGLSTLWTGASWFAWVGLVAPNWLFEALPPFFLLRFFLFPGFGGFPDYLENKQLGMYPKTKFNISIHITKKTYISYLKKEHKNQKEKHFRWETETQHTCGFHPSCFLYKTPVWCQSVKVGSESLQFQWRDKFTTLWTYVSHAVIKNEKFWKITNI